MVRNIIKSNAAISAWDAWEKGRQGQMWVEWNAGQLEYNTTTFTVLISGLGVSGAGQSACGTQYVYFQCCDQCLWRGRAVDGSIGRYASGMLPVCFRDEVFFKVERIGEAKKLGPGRFRSH